jgi:hypothetical protein
MDGERYVWRVKVMRVGGSTVTFYVAAIDDAGARRVAEEAFHRRAMSNFASVLSPQKLGVLEEDRVESEVATEVAHPTE